MEEVGAHRRRRKEGVPVLLEKFAQSVKGCFAAPRSESIIRLCNDAGRLQQTPVQDFMAMTLT
jgi:2-methylcitrate dehydratase